MKTGRDVVIAALLGAEEFGFATAPLVVSGCVMMRVCHLNTCPVGIATQDPELRKKFTGKPEFVENFFKFIAQEVRELMAELGFRTMDEMIGRVDQLDVRQALEHWKAHGLDLSAAPLRSAGGRRPSAPQRRDAGSRPREGARQRADRALQGRARGRGGGRRRRCRSATSTAPSARCSATRSRRASAATGLPDDTIRLQFRGVGRPELRRVRAARHHADARGRRERLRRQGPVGRPADRSTRRGGATFAAEENIIIGNVALYGATSGEAFVRGVAGERFAVRNSGATAVVEGVGDHGCEYMTGGRVVVLGRTGRNFAAGMSGGIAYVLDASGAFEKRVQSRHGRSRSAGRGRRSVAAPARVRGTSR